MRRVGTSRRRRLRLQRVRALCIAPVAEGRCRKVHPSLEACCMPRAPNNRRADARLARRWWRRSTSCRALPEVLAHAQTRAIGTPVFARGCGHTQGASESGAPGFNDSPEGSEMVRRDHPHELADTFAGGHHEAGARDMSLDVHIHRGRELFLDQNKVTVWTDCRSVPDERHLVPWGTVGETS